MSSSRDLESGRERFWEEGKSTAWCWAAASPDQRKRRRLGAMSGGFKIKSRRRLRKPWLKDWLWDLMKLLILTCFEQKKKKKNIIIIKIN